MKTFKKYLAAIVSLCMIAAAFPCMTYASAAERDNTETPWDSTIDKTELAGVTENEADILPKEAVWTDETAEDRVAEKEASQKTEKLFLGIEVSNAETAEAEPVETELAEADIPKAEMSDVEMADEEKSGAEELVGGPSIYVGDNVLATFDSANGHVSFSTSIGTTIYNRDGTLWNDWIQKSGFGADNIRSFSVGPSPGTVYLPEDSTDIFANCTNLTTADLSRFDTSKVKNITRMFYYCKKLTSVDLSGLDMSNVEIMNSAFDGCSAITSLNLNGCITSKTREMYRTFADCENLINLTFGKIDTSHVDGLHGTFSGCKSLTSLDLSMFNTSNMTTMFMTFSSCYDLESLDLTGWDTSNVERMSRMFSGCSSLTYLDLSKFDTSKIQDAEFMFTSCGSFKELDLSSFDLSNLSYTPDYMFYQLNGLTVLKTPKKNTDGNIDLPFTMYDSSGKSYTKLPVLSKSIVLGITAKVAEDYEEAHPEGKTGIKFKDVLDPTHPYYKAIYWAARRGITKGYSDGTFGIDKPCTRGHAIMFIWKMGNSPAPKSVAKSPFADVPKTHPYYKAILWAQQKGITKGYTSGPLKGKFGVDETCTRGQIMTFIWRFKGQPAPKGTTSPFKDVPTTHAYFKAILWGSQNKITSGYTSGPKKGMFGINDNCTRGMIVKFLNNSIKG